jgi:hypothetical protein
MLEYGSNKPTIMIILNANCTNRLAFILTPYFLVADPFARAIIIKIRKIAQVNTSLGTTRSTISHDSTNILNIDAVRLTRILNPQYR